VAGRLVGDKGRVVATDILPMEPLTKVDFLQGDFTEEAVLNQVLDLLGGHHPDLIISDIAPNITGIDSADQASSMYLVELALDFARQVLKPKGDFVAKVFQGAGSEAFLKDLRSSFEKVSVRKPAASRPRSREVYVVARGFRAGAKTSSTHRRA
jgi:23S rRNA (uridine2552-2'-O)-methyltransferase